jgi:hypothetical protein
MGRLSREAAAGSAVIAIDAVRRLKTVDCSRFVNEPLLPRGCF